MSDQVKVRVRLSSEQLDKAKLMVLNDSSNDQLTNVYEGVKVTDNQDGTLTLEGDVYDIGDFEHELFGTTEAVNAAIVPDFPKYDMDGSLYHPQPTEEDERLYREEQDQIEAARQDAAQKEAEYKEFVEWLNSRCPDCNGDGYLVGPNRDDFGTPRPKCMSCNGSGRIAK